MFRTFAPSRIRTCPATFYLSSSLPSPSSSYILSLHSRSSPARPSPTHPSRRPFSASPTKPPTFSYTVAAAFVGKDRRFTPSTHVFHFNPYSRIPPATDRRRKPRLDSGHDAFFVSRVGDTGAVAMGVADGVGGWVDSGVDPADFSHAFCDYMARAAYVHTSSKSPNETLSARRLMQIGYDSASKDPSIQAGGSTACVAIASPDGTLDIANLGDSGFIALRANAISAYSVPQTHGFNTPFQLSIVPQAAMLKAAVFGSDMLLDQPKDSDVASLSLRHGDVLVMASDGVWDNLFNHDILRVVSRLMTDVGAWRNGPAGIKAARNLDALTGVDILNEEAAARAEVESRRKSKSDDAAEKGTAGPQITGVPGNNLHTLQSTLALEIVATAKSASLNRRLESPFGKSVKQHYPQDTWSGGKVDDICVVVTLVNENEPSEEAVGEEN